MFNDALEPTELSNEFQGALGTDALDRFQVIAAQEDTQVNELKESISVGIFNICYSGRCVPGSCSYLTLPERLAS